MSGSSVTELEIGPSYYTTRDLAPREAGLAEPPKAREESDEKKAITATVLSPPCSSGAARKGQERRPRLARGKATESEVLVFRIFPAPQNKVPRGFPPT